MHDTARPLIILFVIKGGVAMNIWEHKQNVI